MPTMSRTTSRPSRAEGYPAAQEAAVRPLVNAIIATAFRQYCDSVPTGGLPKLRATTVVSRGCAAPAASGKARLICDPRHCAHVNNLLTDEAGSTCPIAYDHLKQG
jgi:hypothetical protein